jgi:hypothetical protein
MTPVKLKGTGLLCLQIVKDTLPVEQVHTAVDSDIPQEEDVAGVGIVFGMIRIDGDAIVVNLNIIIGDRGAVFKTRIPVRRDFNRFIREITELSVQQAAYGQKSE